MPISPNSRLLALLVIAFAGLGLTYGLVTPCFESPDEWSHLSVIRYWAEHRTLPPRVLSPRDALAEPDETWYFEHHDPPLYYAPPLYHTLAALLTSRIGMDDLPYLLAPSPSWEKGWAPQSNTDPWNKNIYAHRAEETLAQSDTVRAATLLRALSLGLGAVTVWCAYAMARLLWPDRSFLALGAASFVAFNPQFIALSIGVTNDNLLNALFALALVCMLRFMRAGAKWTRWAMLGGLVGLGLLTKQSGLLLLPLGLLAVVWQRGEDQCGFAGSLLNEFNGCHRKPAESRLGVRPNPLERVSGSSPGIHSRARVSWRKLLTDGSAFLAAALTVGSWWYIRSAILYGDPLGLESHFTSQFPLTRFGLDEVADVTRSYWAAFGWAPLLVEPAVYAAAGLVMLAALVGIAAAVWPGGPLWHTPTMTRRGVALLALAFLLNAVSFARWAVATGVLSGRLMFATLPVVGLLTSWGLFQWGRWKAARWALGLVAGLAFIFAAGVPFRYLRPAYASPRLPSGVPDTAQSVALTFQGGVRLAGYEAITKDLEPGDEIYLTTYWHATVAPGQRYRVWVQLGPQHPAQKVAEHDTWLGGTLYPSDLWRAGDTVRQTTRLIVPDWASAPGLYWVRVGLVDDDTGAQALLADRSSNMVVLGPWRMRTGSTAPAPTCAADFRLGSGVRLLGYDLAQQEPTTWELALYWRAEDVPAANYTVYVHVIDEQGNLLGQHDGPPRSGAYPTSWWLPGDVVVDRHTIRLDEPLTGPARLQVGMYDSRTLVRLPAYGGAGQRLAEDSISLVKIIPKGGGQCSSD